MLFSSKILKLKAPPWISGCKEMGNDNGRLSEDRVRGIQAFATEQGIKSGMGPG